MKVFLNFAHNHILLKILKEIFVVFNIWVKKKFIKEYHNIQILKKVPKKNKYSALIFFIKNYQFIEMNLIDLNFIEKEMGNLFNLKGIIPRELTPLRK